MLWAFAAALLLASPQSRVADDARGRVTGRVVSTYGASAVTVVLASLDSRAERRSTITDARGHFVFEPIADGRYELSIVAAGFTSRRLRDDGSGFASGIVVDVRKGVTSRPIDLVMRRTSSLSGRVIRPNGAAAPGIHLVLAVRRGRELLQLAGTETTTAWDGRYTVADVPPGSYLLLASGVDTLPATVTPTEQAAFEINQTRPEDFVPTLYPGVPAAEAGEPITLVEGVTADAVDVWLAPARRFSISGRASWPDGYDVEHVTIEYGNPADRQASVWTTSDPGGLFTIADVAPGSVVMLARAESSRGPLMGIVSTDVRVGNVEDLTLALTIPGSITGRVTFASDVPIASRPKTIALIPKLLNVSPLYPTPDAPVGADGTFRMGSVLGDYEFTLPGTSSGLRITSVSRDGRSLAGNRVGIAAGEHVDGIVVTMGR